MLETGIYIALAITVAITGYIAFRFVRDAEEGMVWATHHHALLPRVMTGRYVMLFLFTLGVMIYGDINMIAWLFAVCAFVGFYDGWLYRANGLPHGKHTFTGVLALGALGLTLFTMLQIGDAT
jgi:hypothetical protein